MSSKIQLIVFSLYIKKGLQNSKFICNLSFKVPQSESVITISRIARDDEVKPQSNQKKLIL